MPSDTAPPTHASKHFHAAARISRLFRCDAISFSTRACASRTGRRAAMAFTPLLFYSCRTSPARLRSFEILRPSRRIQRVSRARDAVGRRYGDAAPARLADPILQVGAIRADEAAAALLIHILQKRILFTTFAPGMMKRYCPGHDTCLVAMCITRCLL